METEALCSDESQCVNPQHKGARSADRGATYQGDIRSNIARIVSRARAMASPDYTTVHSAPLTQGRLLRQWTERQERDASE